MSTACLSTRVYKTNLISTIVDLSNSCLRLYVYKTNLISTIVDWNQKLMFSARSIRLI